MPSKPCSYRNLQPNSTSAGTRKSLRPKANRMKNLNKWMGGTLLLLTLSATLAAQGILTVTPGRAASTAAGTGTVGYTGDNAAATAAIVAAPAAVAADAAGNLYIADTQNHAIRRVTPAGTITTVAGTGIAGFSGDGGAATSAQLDTPAGIAVDGNGTLYIADTHNQRVRRVANGTITTVAGNGTAAFAGDGGTATAASLSSPSAVALDATGNLYIADTGNQRIRRVTAAAISTVAGTGDQGFSGDGAAATAAALDSPIGIAVDAAGTLYIADRHNHRIRAVASTGIITTLAGSGTPDFAGSFSGDGAASTAAALSRPSGVSVDAAGNVYIADTNNQRIRQAGNGGIATVYGSGDQAPGANALNTPRGLTVTSSGNLTVADSLNQRSPRGHRNHPFLCPAGCRHAEPVAGGDPREHPATRRSRCRRVAATSNFTIAPGGTCPAAPVTLAPGTSCTVNVTFTQSIGGSTSGSLTVGGAGIPSQTVLLAAAATVGGSTVQTATATTLVSSQANPLLGQPVTYTVQVASGNGVGTPTGTVALTANGLLLGTITLYNGVGQFTTAFTTSVPEAIVATYGGDTYYSTSSATYTQTVDTFTFAPGSGAGFSVSVVPGQSGTYTFNVAPVNGTFPYPITFSATGAPAGSVITFTPSSVTLGASPATVTMTVKVPAALAALRHTEQIAGAGLAFALLLLPFSSRLRHPGSGGLLLLLCAGAGLAALGGLTGCGSSSTGFFTQSPRTYTIVVTATATTPSGSTLQQSTNVTLVVQ